jgi:hypothetical protein
MPQESATVLNPVVAMICAAQTVRLTAEAANVAGLELAILTAATPREIDAAFASLPQNRVDALFVDPG